MSSPSPILLVLDLSALMAGSHREWQEFARVGICYLPEVVLEEMNFLSNRAVEAEDEQKARGFLRFQPTSGWQLTNVTLSHPMLNTGSGAALSKKARLSLEVAESAYGLSEAYPTHLVVLVANDQPLLQSVQRIGATNLCGITLVALLQWARTHQKPLAVIEKLKAMQGAGPGKPSAKPTPRPSPTTPQRPTPAATGGPASASRYRVRSNQPSTLSQLISGAIVVIGIAIGLLIAWRLLQPTSFQKFWQQTGLPALPGDPPTRRTR